MTISIETDFTGRVVMDGSCDAPALVTKEPLNFVAALTKLHNLLPTCRSQIRDTHHDLFGERLKGRVLVLPACIGSTYTGLVLLELINAGEGPSAIIVGAADPLILSGIVAAKVWSQHAVPLIELNDPKFHHLVKTGDRIRIENGTGRISVG